MDENISTEHYKTILIENNNLKDNKVLKHRTHIK